MVDCYDMVQLRFVILSIASHPSNTKIFSIRFHMMDCRALFDDKTIVFQAFLFNLPSIIQPVKIHTLLQNFIAASCLHRITNHFSFYFVLAFYLSGQCVKDSSCVVISDRLFQNCLLHFFTTTKCFLSIYYNIFQHIF